MSNDTIIKTAFNRELTVKDYGYAFNLGVKDTEGSYAEKGQVTTHLEPEEATQLASALLGENATVVTDLPEVEVSENGLYAKAGDVQRRIEYYTAEDFLTSAKQYLALHAFMVKHDAEKEAAKAAEAEKEAQRNKRREELAKTFTGNADAKYRYCFTETKAGIDRLIAAEEAAQVS